MKHVTIPYMLQKYQETSNWGHRLRFFLDRSKPLAPMKSYLHSLYAGKVETVVRRKSLSWFETARIYALYLRLRPLVENGDLPEFAPAELVGYLDSLVSGATPPSIIGFEESRVTFLAQKWAPGAFLRNGRPFNPVKRPLRSTLTPLETRVLTAIFADREDFEEDLEALQQSSFVTGMQRQIADWLLYHPHLIDEIVTDPKTQRSMPASLLTDIEGEEGSRDLPVTIRVLTQHGPVPLLRPSTVKDVGFPALYDEVLEEEE